MQKSIAENNLFIEFSEHRGFYSTTEELPEVVEEMKEMLHMQPRKTWEQMKKEISEKRQKRSN